MKEKKFLENFAIGIILILAITLSCYIYKYSILEIKKDILSSQQQISILRDEMQEIKSYLDSTAIQMYNLEKQMSIQAEHILDLEKQNAEHEKQIKLDAEHNVIEEVEVDTVKREDVQVVGVRESVVAFTITTLKGIKDNIMGWRANIGF